MLGHRLLLSLRERHDVAVTLRQERSAYTTYGIFDEHAYYGVDVRSQASLIDTFSDFAPEVVINGVGIIKQRPSAKESIPSLEVNALLPHRLALLCKVAKARLLHLSTDCVFNGKRGNYLETDLSDAEDLYGKSKFLGEVHEPHCLTLRTSIIGPELSRKHSLYEWFLGQTGTIKGFSRAFYNGFTTLEMARILEKMIVDHPAASGVYQVSSEPIDKYSLLLLCRDYLKKEITINEDSEFHCDRTLDSGRFRKEFNYRPPTWDAMISEMTSC